MLAGDFVTKSWEIRCFKSALSEKKEMRMRRKSIKTEAISMFRGLGKDEIPYQVDNVFYESFGMSYDELFESLCADSIDIMSSFY